MNIYQSSVLDMLFCCHVFINKLNKQRNHVSSTVDIENSLSLLHILSTVMYKLCIFLLKFKHTMLNIFIYTPYFLQNKVISFEF